MANNSRLTYIEPVERFKKINMDVILVYEPVVVGIYCKLATISSGKSLSIDYLSKTLHISKERMRSTIVLLEKDGYITRKPLKDENGHLAGWNYCLYAEPVNRDMRTHAGVKDGKKESARVKDLPCYGFSDNTENAKHNIIIDNTISNNDIDRNIYIDKKSTNVDTNMCDEFTLYMRQHYPYIMKMDKPLTQSQATKLKEEYGEETVLKVFDAMDNYKQLLKKYRDAYKTADNWCKREMPAPKPQQQPKED